MKQGMSGDTATSSAGATSEKADEMHELPVASFSFLKPSDGQDAGRYPHLSFILVIFP